jgi:hypothetical protein
MVNIIKAGWNKTMKINNEILYSDAICCVLANVRTKEIVYDVLNSFIPNYEKIDGEYYFSINGPKDGFKNEDEILDYLISNKYENGTLFWNKNEKNPYKIMVGAFFTTDAKLIISLTVKADGTIEDKFLEKLKNLLNSKIGTISYVNPPEFEDGNDFMNKYQ